MSLRTYLVVALAVVFGLSAALGINLFLRSTPAMRLETTPVVVAVVDVDRLVPLTAAHLALKEVPKEAVPPGALTQIDDAVNRVSGYPIPRNSFVMEHLLSKKGTRSVAAAIPQGKCAFPVHGGNVSALIQPGDRVDVILTVKDKAADYRSVTILSMIEVIAVNGSLVPDVNPKTDGKEPHSVTLAVTHEEARDLDSAQKLGSIRLTLRNAGDTLPVSVTRLADLRIEPPVEEAQVAPQPAPAAPAAPPPPVQIRTLRGTQPGVLELSGEPPAVKGKVALEPAPR